MVSWLCCWLFFSRIFSRRGFDGLLSPHPPSQKKLYLGVVDRLLLGAVWERGIEIVPMTSDNDIV